MTDARLRTQIYASTADAGFADRLAAALDAEGFEIVTGEFERLKSDAVVVVWSGASRLSRGLKAAAKAPFEAGVLIPVAIGAIDPPEGFEALPPADLAGWSGAADDPRWRFVVEEIRRAAGARPAQAAPFPADVPALDVFAPRTDDFGHLHHDADETSLIGSAHRRPRRPARAPILAATLAFTAAALAGGFAVIGGYVKLPDLRPATPSPVAEARPQNPSHTDALAAAVIAKSAPHSGAPISDAGDEVPLAQASQTQDLAADEAEGAGESATVATQTLPENEASAQAAPPSKSPADAEKSPEESEDAIAALIQKTAPPAEAALSATPATTPPAGTFFKDCESCPEMAALAAGRYTMGSPPDEKARHAAEGPQTEVAVPSFAIGTREVTFEQWDACVAAGGCAKYRPGAGLWGRGRQPVVNVSWRDAQSYVEWLSQSTGRPYRLPTEAEWEYAARAGTTTPFAFGEGISANEANFDGSLPYGEARGKSRNRPIAVGSFKANAWGLFDMHGNVWEWVGDCWKASLLGRPADAAAVANGCASRVLKGGAFNNGGWRLRSAHRIGKNASVREFDNGFRVARDL